MTDKLEQAFNKVETSYSDLIELANNSLSSIIEPTNKLVAEVSSKVNNLTVDQIRDFILRLQLKAFELSEIKEKAVMKAELSNAIQKETLAINFSGADGAVAAKEKVALINTSGEVVSSVLYNLMSNLLKTKVDQLHRLVDALKSILVSRMQETKFINLGAAEDPDQYKTLAQIREENSRQI